MDRTRNHSLFSRVNNKYKLSKVKIRTIRKHNVDNTIIIVYNNAAHLNWILFTKKFKRFPGGGVKKCSY